MQSFPLDTGLTLKEEFSSALKWGLPPLILDANGFKPQPPEKKKDGQN